MGNCQAIDDNASLVIQHPGGRAEKHYWPLSATEIMNTNPGHYVALLLTTTATTLNSSAAAASTNNVPPVQRITRIKLLKPTDTLVLGHVYRLVTAQAKALLVPSELAIADEESEDWICGNSEDSLSKHTTSSQC
nr:uncharacterized protein LOC109149302 isoform X4 [Ipomoea batatas]GMC50624.1 uncharacterized protein LOC109149302 isoform X4 [Ipomoea batatas]